MTHYTSFVLRLWVGDDGKITRGYVQQTGTEEIAHFVDMSKMLEFVESHLQRPQDGLPEGEVGLWLAIQADGWEMP
jgi:hypothetical protein